MATIYSPIWSGSDSNGTWSFQARTTYTTSGTNTTYTVTIGDTYLRQTDNRDVHGDGGWHSGAVIRSSAYRKIYNNTTKPTITAGYLKIVNNVSASDLYFATSTSWKKVGSGGTMIINKTHDAQTVYINCLGYRSTTKGNFNGLAEGINTGANSTAGTSIAITIPAMAKYTITYNANGGENVPDATSEFVDTETTITSGTPTRNNYTFKGWSTTLNGTVDYNSEDQYTAKTSITLYAVWEYGYGISGGNTTAIRTDADGNASDDGSYSTITGNYTLTGGLENTGSITARYKKTTEDTWTTITSTITQSNNTKPAGTPELNVTFSVAPFGVIDPNSTYNIEVIATDTNQNSVTMSDFISQAFFTMDFKAGGKEIAFGTPATDDLTDHENGLFKCKMDANFEGNLEQNSVPVSLSGHNHNMSDIVNLPNWISSGNGSGVVLIGDLLIQYGNVSLTPSGTSANYSASRTITFNTTYKYKYTPIIQTTAQSGSNLNVIRSTFADPSKTGFTLWLIRSNKTETGCWWVAIGQKE